MALVTSVQDGPWSDADTWDAGVPQANDDVVIENAVTLDVDTAALTSLYAHTGSLTGLLGTETLDADAIGIDSVLHSLKVVSSLGITLSANNARCTNCDCTGVTHLYHEGPGSPFASTITGSTFQQATFLMGGTITGPATFSGDVHLSADDVVFAGDGWSIGGTLEIPTGTNGTQFNGAGECDHVTIAGGTDFAVGSFAFVSDIDNGGTVTGTLTNSGQTWIGSGDWGDADSVFNIRAPLSLNDVGSLLGTWNIYADTTIANQIVNGIWNIYAAVLDVTQADLSNQPSFIFRSPRAELRIGDPSISVTYAGPSAVPQPAYRGAF